MLGEGETKAQKDRRAKKRYQVSTRVRFRWQNAAGEWISSTGVTRDMSVSGAYILCQHVPDVHAPIEVQVAVTPYQAMSKASLCGKGSVTRTNFGIGFAAQLALQLFRTDRADSVESW